MLRPTKLLILFAWIMGLMLCILLLSANRRLTRLCSSSWWKWRNSDHFFSFSTVSLVNWGSRVKSAMVFYLVSCLGVFCLLMQQLQLTVSSVSIAALTCGILLSSFVVWCENWLSLMYAPPVGLWAPISSAPPGSCGRSDGGRCLISPSAFPGTSRGDTTGAQPRRLPLSAAPGPCSVVWFSTVSWLLS